MSKITTEEQRCYRLRHHSFAGLTRKETAKQMGITLSRVDYLLQKLKAKAPQLFPILTHQQHIIYWLRTTKKLTQYEIADYLGVEQSQVCETLKQIKKKGIPFPKQFNIEEVAYEKNMDDKIAHKF